MNGASNRKRILVAAKPAAIRRSAVRMGIGFRLRKKSRPAKYPAQSTA